ncbi:MAG: hypothetical protein ACHQM6_05450, partial [Candidatus Kapaibacterium sp.]
MKTVYSFSLRTIMPLVLCVAIMGMFSFTPRNSRANLSLYTLKTGFGNAMPSAGTVLWTGHQGARYMGLVSAPINLGFSFTFDGTSYSQIIVYSSGLLSFGSTQVSNGTTPSLANTNVPVVAGFWGGQSLYTGRQSVGFSGAALSAAGWGGP